MGIARALPDVENWLDVEAESWSVLSDREYVAIVQRWLNDFRPAIAARKPSFDSIQAMQAIVERLPADVIL